MVRDEFQKHVAQDPFALIQTSDKNERTTDGDRNAS